MSKFGSYELTHPELLSEHQLCEILKNTCIEVLNFRKLGKSELLEIYKRVAMPLPQRQHSNDKNSNAEQHTILEKSLISVKEYDNCSSATDCNIESKRTCQISHLQTDRVRSPVNDQKSMCKKVRLCSTSKAETACNGINKRRCDERNEESLMKKRQKITWP